MDCIDFCLTLQTVSFKQERWGAESSYDIKKRVTMARERQYDRYGGKLLNNRVPFHLIQGKIPITSGQMDDLHQVC